MIAILMAYACNPLEKLETIKFIPFGSSFTAPNVARVGQNIDLQVGEKTTGASSFLWNFGYKNKISREKNPVFAYDSIGTYNLTLSVEMDKLNGKKSSDTTRKIIIIPVTDSVTLAQQGKVFGQTGVDELVLGVTRLNNGNYVAVGRENISDLWVGILNPTGVLIDSLDNASFKLTNSLITPRSIVNTNDGGFVIVGSILTGAGDRDAFILKFDQTGDLDWGDVSTNSSSDEYYTGVVEVNKNGKDILIVSLTTAESSRPVVILHQFSSSGKLIMNTPTGESDFLGNITITNEASAICSSCRGEVLEKVLVDNNQARFLVAGTSVDNPMITEFTINLTAPTLVATRSVSVLTEYSGVAKAVKFLTGGRYAVAGTLNLSNNQTNLKAFIAKLDQIGGNITSWDKTFQVYSDDFIALTEDAQNNILVLGVNENPLSKKDISLTKFKRDGRGELIKTILIGNNEDNVPTNFYRNPLTNDLLIIGTIPEPGTSLIRRKNISVIKTTTEF
ncbi:MAG: hypothetical protein EAZ85_12700 [Bacteroidetes bacterium]|nr:MAG: hypothetical protein EAZ85_12700 [Bacteroidota bacterium]TAG87157.1 MAG: hypothetical protein EAZ20_11240 [Bacteroidota bacterium]